MRNPSLAGTMVLLVLLSLELPGASGQTFPGEIQLLAAGPLGKRCLVVTSQRGGDGDQVCLVDLETSKVLATRKTPQLSAVHLGARRAYLALAGANQLTVLPADLSRVTGTVGTDGPVVRLLRLVDGWLMVQTRRAYLRLSEQDRLTGTHSWTRGFPLLTRLDQGFRIGPQCFGPKGKPTFRFGRIRLDRTPGPELLKLHSPTRWQRIISGHDNVRLSRATGQRASIRNWPATRGMLLPGLPVLVLLRRERLTDTIALRASYHELRAGRLLDKLDLQRTPASRGGGKLVMQATARQLIVGQGDVLTIQRLPLSILRTVRAPLHFDLRLPPQDVGISSPLRFQLRTRPNQRGTRFASHSDPSIRCTATGAVTLDGAQVWARYRLRIERRQKRVSARVPLDSNGLLNPRSYRGLLATWNREAERVRESIRADVKVRQAAYKAQFGRETQGLPLAVQFRFDASHEAETDQLSGTFIVIVPAEVLKQALALPPKPVERAYALACVAWVDELHDEELAPQQAPLLWRVEIKGKPPSYLLGTIHTQVPAKQLHPAALRAFLHCTRLVVESDPQGLDPSEVSRLSQLPQHESLRSMLAQKTWRDLCSLLSKVPESQLDRLEPWFVAMMLSVQLSGGAKSDEMMDAWLIQRSRRELGKTVHALERWDRPINALRARPRKDWIADLAQIVAQPDWTTREAKRLGQIYLSGDSRALERVIRGHGSPGHSDALLKALLDDRNAQWLNDVQRLVNEGNTLVAVGAGHLIGKGSLVELLRAKGFRVTRVLGGKQKEPVWSGSTEPLGKPIDLPTDPLPWGRIAGFGLMGLLLVLAVRAFLAGRQRTPSRKIRPSAAQLTPPRSHQTSPIVRPASRRMRETVARGKGSAERLGSPQGSAIPLLLSFALGLSGLTFGLYLQLLVLPEMTETIAELRLTHPGAYITPTTDPTTGMPLGPSTYQSAQTDQGNAGEQLGLGDLRSAALIIGALFLIIGWILLRRR